MRKNSIILFPLGLILSGLLLPCWADTATLQYSNEYNVLWDTSRGGPQSIEQVFKVLRLKPNKKQIPYSVSYLDMKTHPYMTLQNQATNNQAAGSMATDKSPVQAILRRRAFAGGNYDLTYKLRGLDVNTNIVCPLQGGIGDSAKTKWEYDIGYGFNTDKGIVTNRVLSYSCTITQKLPPALPASIQLGNTKLLCSPQVIRRSAKISDRQKFMTMALPVVVELWTIGAKQLLSVSYASTKDEQMQFQQQVVLPLEAVGVKPELSSKTMQAEGCS